MGFGSTPLAYVRKSRGRIKHALPRRSQDNSPKEKEKGENKRDLLQVLTYSLDEWGITEKRIRSV
jgi:hypothetical protein